MNIFLLKYQISQHQFPSSYAEFPASTPSPKPNPPGHPTFCSGVSFSVHVLKFLWKNLGLVKRIRMVYWPWRLEVYTKCNAESEFFTKISEVAMVDGQRKELSTHTFSTLHYWRWPGTRIFNGWKNSSCYLLHVSLLRLFVFSLKNKKVN